MAFNIDKTIERLLEARFSTPFKTVELKEAEIRELCTRARALLLSQPMLLELDAPIKICGDIHGQYTDLLRLFEFAGYPTQHNYLFLGDYVDRGRQQIETICLLLAFKVKFPRTFFMLRGNHEDKAINEQWGFMEECKQRYNMGVYNEFNSTFQNLPIAAIVGDSIFCAHGGISPKLTNMDQIRNIKRPLPVPRSAGTPHEVMLDLLWSDPHPGTKLFAPNSDRNVSVFIGPDLIDQFLKRFNLQLIVRAHQVVMNGYEFFADRKLVTVFSAPNYTGAYDNAGAVMVVDKDLKCTFQIMQPSHKSTTLEAAKDAIQALRASASGS
ncbi:serine/threonine-protein phosphatase alpha-3 isoform-like [Sycon ciliatum]|uniref:serine/threonine-protein phosphatase alpha-3 isoform-like n=1 Tax=Sycon ciliatum TaxID=27933 RepID=UPI0020A9A612|eukprot:scpid79186/ scgid7145/ Serine/threonine-protein phosphatase PP1-beta catalytic subunit; Serine/threonine-protein phosphatase PP1-beta catalytic subunit